MGLKCSMRTLVACLQPAPHSLVQHTLFCCRSPSAQWALPLEAFETYLWRPDTTWPALTSPAFTAFGFSWWVTTDRCHVALWLHCGGVEFGDALRQG